MNTMIRFHVLILFLLKLITGKPLGSNSCEIKRQDICSELGYDYTSFPNQLGHSTQEVSTRLLLVRYHHVVH